MYWLLALLGLVLIVGISEPSDVLVVNDLREKVVAAYELGRSFIDASRGPNLLDAALEYGDSLLLHDIPEGKMLLFQDYLGNDYIFSLPENLSEDGSLLIGTGGICLFSYHSGTGRSPLHVVNSLTDLRLDSVFLGSSDTDMLENHLLFPGDAITIWVNPGFHSVRFVDQTGANFYMDSVYVPDSGLSLPIRDEDLPSPQPIASWGSGDAILLLESRIAASPLVRVTIGPAKGASQSIPLQAPLRAGDRLLLRLPSGTYDFTATDEDGAVYFINAVECTSGATLWLVSNRDMMFDFGLPFHSDSR